MVKNFLATCLCLVPNLGFDIVLVVKNQYTCTHVLAIFLQILVAVEKFLTIKP